MKQLKYCRYDDESKVLLSKDEPEKFDEPCFASFLLNCFNKHSERPFLTDSSTGITLTYRQVKETSLQIASSFMRHLLLDIGDVIFGYCFTSSIYACSVYACSFAGLVFTGAPARLTPVSLLSQINDSRSKVVLCESESLSRLLEALEQCPLVETIILLDCPDESSSIGHQIDTPRGIKMMTMADLMAFGDANDEKVPRSPNCDVKNHLVYLPYSSGTTGLPKGVKRCAHSLISMCYNVKERGMLYGESSDVVSLFQSLGHSSGAFTIILNLFHGARLIMIPELDLESLLGVIDKYKVTCTLIPPTLIQSISKMDVNEKFNLSSIEFICTGGAPLASAVVKDFVGKFRNLQKLMVLYALSEGPMATVSVDSSDDYKSIGALIAGVELKVVNRDTGAVCSFNETGEIHLRSDMSASGYSNRPEAEAETWSQDGWVRTGDAGYYNEDGLVFLVDRYKEMIKVHINQVAPAELQDILCRHPQVSEACVVAAPHPDTGETPRAFVVPRNTNELPDEEEIVNFLNDQVIEYRRIRGGLYLVTSLPKIVVGKVNRQLVKSNPEKLEYLNPNNSLSGPR